MTQGIGGLVFGLCAMALGCSSSVPSTSTGSGSSNGAETPACSTDGSDGVIVGSYSYDWNNTMAGAFALDVLMPNCELCEDPYHEGTDYGLTSGASTWSSAWSSDHSSITITLSNGMTLGVADSHGHSLVTSGGANSITMSRITGIGDPDLLKCDGYYVLSSTNYSQ